MGSDRNRIDERRCRGANDESARCDFEGGGRLTGWKQRIATIDLDATVIESFKREVLRTYEGTTGYQPMMALWAEMDLAVADEFRDGNVPAAKVLLPVAQRAF